MNFNIYLDDDTGQRLNRAAEVTGESRNSLIRKAVDAWLRDHCAAQWPAEVLAFTGVADMPSFESYRDELQAPSADPLA